ncbi:MAG: type I 3-dehydroquinate dehydratase [Spirochaetales bacterium]|nr:type I 3-dehydroquinate dehydratase [Spirochaetales bacterium]
MRVGPLRVGEIPRLVAIVDRPTPPADLLALQTRGVRVIEFRLDAFPGGGAEALSWLSTVAGNAELRRQFALLGTLRDQEPFAHVRLPDFERLVHLVDLIDVEYEAGREKHAIVQCAQRVGCRTLLSSHDFHRTPPEAEMQAVFDDGVKLRVDMVKLAVMTESATEVRRLLAITERNAGRKGPLPVSIAMGPAGMVSRVIAPLFGSTLTYGYLDQPNAPAQLSVDEIHNELLRFFPDYRADFEQHLAAPRC